MFVTRAEAKFLTSQEPMLQLGSTVYWPQGQMRKHSIAKKLK